MDRQALKNQAASRRNRGAEPASKVNWTCEYCNHPFATETGFMNHRCRGREKLEELKSPIGQAAYAYYTEWMKMNKRSVPSIETFSESKLYSSFIKFAQWVVKVRLPNTTGFIRAMVMNGKISPTLWCRDNVYAMYMEGYDNVVHPTVQFLDTHENLIAMAKLYPVPVQDVFIMLGVDGVLEFVQQRKLSPWFLIASQVFRTWLKSLPLEDQDRVESALQIGAMLNRISHNESLKVLLTEFSKATKELGL